MNKELNRLRNLLGEAAGPPPGTGTTGADDELTAAQVVTIPI
jgi:hypothetical protein